ncbi:MAG: beta-lactamase family protein [Chlorobi bacterium]|nr:beta-lactamase family protein [Chlorobiota bacterium]
MKLILYFSGIISFVVILSSIGCERSLTAQHDNNDNNIDLDSFALAIKQQYMLPGLAIATIKDSKISDIAVVGMNKAQKGYPLSVESKFQIASCTKSFTALLVATFVEENLISWETKISDVFKDISIHKGYQNITIRQVLSHTAGLAQFWTDGEVFGIKNIIPDLNGSISERRRKFTQWNLSQKPPFTVGEHHYSNGGYVIIAALLEEISGKSFEMLMKQRIFRKLELNSAEFGYPFLYDTSQPYRHMYRDENNIGISMDRTTRIPDEIFNPSGFISLTIKDFARYASFYTKVLKGEDAGFNRKAVMELFKPVVKLENTNEIGLGWQIIKVNGIATYGHTGSDKTMRSAIAINPETGNAVVFTTNIGDRESELAMVSVIYKILDL